MMGAAKEGGHLHKLLSEYTRPQQRQTILASATIPQHRRFLNDCIQNKWVKVAFCPLLSDSSTLSTAGGI